MKVHPDMKLVSVLALSAVPLLLHGATAGFEDSTAYLIREGGTSSIFTDYEAETFTLTANNGGKAVIAIDAMLGSQVGALRNLYFSSEGPTDTGFPYFNFWVTDGNGNYAFVAINMLYPSGGGDDLPVYFQMTSPGGMDRQYFQSLQVRVYGTNTGDLSWIYPDAVQQSKFGSWAQALWKSNDSQLIDPVTVSDIAHLQIISPFIENQHVPGIPNPPEWPYAGTGEPQLAEGLYIVAGDTSASNTGSFVIGDLYLEYDEAATTQASGGATVTPQQISTGDSGGEVEVDGGYFATALTQVLSGGSVSVSNGAILQTSVIAVDMDGALEILGSSTVEANEGIIAGELSLGEDGTLIGGNGGLLLMGNINGSGTLSNLGIMGHVSVGNSPGHMNFEGVIFESGSSIFMEIEGAEPGQFDTIYADETTDFSGANLTIIFSNYIPGWEETFQLFTGDADLSVFNSITTPDGWVLDTATGVLHAVPEPRTVGTLLGIMALGFALYTRRNRK